MGVSYYACKCCGESIYEEYVGACTECSKYLCTECLVNDDVHSDYASDYGVIYDGSIQQKEKYGIQDDWEEKGWVTIDEVIDDTSISPKYCPYCQGYQLDKEKFYNWLLNKLEKSEEDLINEYEKETQ